MSRAEIFKIAAIFLLAGLLFFFRLGDRPLRNPDEGRYAELSREMLQSGDWVKPTLFGLGYLRKPPLFYWLVAASFKGFGVNEWSARAVPAWFGMAGVALVYFFTRRFLGSKSALWASLILASNIAFVQIGRYLVIDAVFSFFLTGSLFLFYAALRSRRRSTLFFLFYVFLGLAFLAKGLAAVVIAAFSISAYLLWTRHAGEWE